MEPVMDPDLTVTTNNSSTYRTTKNACLDFHSGAMQKTPTTRLIELLELAWSEDSLLTLKLMFQLRDIRHGKGAMIEFHHCLIWLYNHHPKTLLFNLEFVATTGYWKDLSWLTKFICENVVATTTPKSSKQRDRSRGIPSARSRGIFSARGRGNLSARSRGIPLAHPSETFPEEILIRKRVNGEVDRQTWQQHLRGLPNEEARKVAKEKFQKIAQEVHLERSQKAKETKKQAKVNYSQRLAELCNENENFRLLYDRVVDLFASALLKDKNTLSDGRGLKTEAIAGKWAPRVGGSIDNVTSLGKAIARKLYCSRVGEEVVESAVDDDEADRRAFAFYRKAFVTPLRQNIQVPERYMSANKWEEIDYQRVPSKCMKRNKKHFLKRDTDRFQTYLGQVKTGEKKIASGALLPHEIVGKVHGGQREAADLEQVTELQWRDYVNNLKKSGTLKSALSVCDVSGSMAGTPMDVAIALSLLTSEVSEPPFHGLICTFSEIPRLLTVNQETLREKVDYVRRMPWGFNTNFQAVFDCILELAKETKLASSDMVKTVFVYSDMEFDEACGRGHRFETDYQVIKRKFTEAGYPLPSMVFWNLKGSQSKPVTMNEQNVALVSGFSGQMLKFFLEHGEFSNPYTAMIEALGNRYDHLKVVD